MDHKPAVVGNTTANDTPNVPMPIQQNGLKQESGNGAVPVGKAIAGSTNQTCPEARPFRPDIIGNHHPNAPIRPMPIVTNMEVFEHAEKQARIAAESPDSAMSMSKSLRQRPGGDEHRWRKYGQKRVNGHARAYYRCSYPDCPVKKKVEPSKTEPGAFISMVTGEHNHPVRQITRVNANDQTSFRDTVAAAPLSSPVSFGTPTSPMLSPASAKASPGRSPYTRGPNNNDVSEPRLVVQTPSSVNPFYDGYKWRKYGEKLLKGTANRRMYLKCSEVDCPVRKYVEKVESGGVVTTYEGHHTHPPRQHYNIEFDAAHRTNGPPASRAKKPDTKGLKRKLQSDINNYNQSDIDAVAALVQFAARG